MKNYVCLFAALFLWCALMPSVVRPSESGQAAATETYDVEESEETPTIPDIKISYYDKTVDGAMEIELEEYVAKALTALVSNDAPMEMLKAQAVAIRSVVCYRYEHKEHSGFYLCDDVEHCFELSETPNDRCKEAVNATRGLLLTCEGKAALALSHLSSCAKTESYETVYGTKVPYLIAVPVEDESGFEGYKTQYDINYNKFKDAFSDYNTVFQEDKTEWIGNLTYTGGNRVYTIEIGGLCFKGGTFANLFGLKSLCFTVEQTDTGFIISCYGNGHGIGMSRNSAILMARDGKDYKEILAYFYPKTKLSVINNA